MTLLLLLGGAGPVAAVVINFDNLADGVVVSSQYPEATFSSTAGFVNLTAAQSLGSSLPNFICTGPAGGGTIDCTHETIVTFTSPVSGLTFLEIGDNNEGVNALVDVFVNGVLAATVGAVGDADGFVPNLVDLSAFSNVTSIRIHSITDVAGLGWDDFTFTVGASQVPEPGTVLLLGAAGIALAVAGWRRGGRN